MKARVFLCALLLGTCSVSFGQNVEFKSSWPAGITRTWPGPAYYANRFVDWQVNNGRLECVTSHRMKPMRTVHLLTHPVSNDDGVLEVSVTTGPLKPGLQRGETAWTGFLIGVGGDHVDYRASALCHHWAAEDGGMIAAFDGTGRVVFRDNSRLTGTRPKSLAAWPLMQPDRLEGPTGASLGTTNSVTLHLRAQPSESGYQVTLSAHDTASNKLIHRAVIDNVSPAQVDGNVAIVSHSMGKPGQRGYWYKDWHVRGSKVRHHPDRAFGPILSAQHTVSRGVLKLTAQMPALGAEDTRTARLEVRNDKGAWKVAAQGTLVDHAYSIPFRVEAWDVTKETAYRVAYDLKTGMDETETHHFTGSIRAAPTRDEFRVAAFTGHHISAKGVGHWNGNSIWYPHNELVSAVDHHAPDLLFFSGDQIYESGLAGVIRRPTDAACVDYLYHWVRWCWAFRDLARDIPCISIPDDHDVYHGNVWGAGGKKAVRIPGVGGNAADSGGYTMDPVFVNAVHATQTSHLPDPVDPKPIQQGITVYHTRMEYAGLSFAIIADRMFKSSPSVMCKGGNCKNGWFRNPEYDPRTQSDVEGAVLLGDRQLRFLEHWAGDWSDRAWMKVLLSQTIFANLATLPKSANNDGVVPGLRYAKTDGYIEGDKLAADGDSNGWPRSGRDRALRAIRKGFAFHIAGDQHLPTFSQYGIDEWNDAPYAFCVPSIANFFPRRFFPPTPGRNRKPGSPRYTGEHEDGFGNKITVHAVGNPVRSGVAPAALYDRMPGYGIVRFHRSTREIHVECWPRWVNPAGSDAKMFDGWPVTVTQAENYGRTPTGWLPTFRVQGMEDAVVRVDDETQDTLVYAIRMKGNEFRPPVFGPGPFRVTIGEPGTPRLKTLSGVKPTQQQATIEIDLKE